LKAIIIDDEQLARDLIRSFLLAHPSIQLIGECSDGFEGMKTIQELKPDLIFLDIQMPKITGFEMLELIEDPPVVIFTTAYNEFAIKAFEMNAVDYLLKPFSRDRFSKALEKAEEKCKHKEEDQKKLKELVNNNIYPSEKIERILVKTGSKIKIIPVNDLQYLEAQDDYVMLYIKEGKYLKQQTMKFFEAHLDPSLFVRIHRSYIVNINEVVQIEAYEKESYCAVLKNHTKLPISKSGYSQLKKVLYF
jgi:two-component system, LytTR family, response regulator